MPKIKVDFIHRTKIKIDQRTKCSILWDTGRKYGGNTGTHKDFLDDIPKTQTTKVIEMKWLQIDTTKKRIRSWTKSQETGIRDLQKRHLMK